MSKHILGGLVVAAFFASSAAAAPAQPATPAQHGRGSFFTSNENRSDVPARIEKMFKKLDSNHDGLVSKQEIVALQAQFEQRSAKSAPTRAAHLFEHLDANHDGKITQEEVDASRAKRLTASGKSAKASRRGGATLLARADANKDAPAPSSTQPWLRARSRCGTPACAAARSCGYSMVPTPTRTAAFRSTRRSRGRSKNSTAPISIITAC